MSTMDVFMAYAADFEKSYADDEWSRLHRYFHDDATYRIVSDAFGAEITGPAAICAGFKKSLDGMDRRFDSRDIEVKDGPHLDGAELRIGWEVTYRKGDLPPFVLPGVSTVEVRDDRIAVLTDAFDDIVTTRMQEWIEKNGFEFDPSYV